MLSERMQKCLDAFEKNKHDEDYIPATTSEIERWKNEVAQLEAELESYKGSFILYDEAQTRATKMWQERTGETILPDSCKLYIWLLEQLQCVEAERDALVEILFEADGVLEWLEGEGRPWPTEQDAITAYELRKRIEATRKVEDEQDVIR